MNGFSGRYRSAQTRARVTCILLGLVALITLIWVIQEGSGLRIVDDARNKILYPYEANNYARSTAFVVYLYLGAVSVTAIAFLAWLSRSVENVPALGGGKPLVTPRWSIGWWFVPVANLLKPYQIARDLHDRMGLGESSGGGWIIVSWWVLFVVGNALSLVAAAWAEPKNLDALSALYSIRGTAAGLAFLGTVAAITVVLRIQWRAEQRADALGPVKPGTVVPA